MLAPPTATGPASGFAEAEPSTPRLGATEYGLIALQSAFWGSAFFFVAVAAGGLPPVTMAAARLISAAALMALILAWRGIAMPADAGTWARLAILGTLNTLVPFILVIYAQREVSGGTAAILNATAPLFGVVLAPFFIAEERFAWRRLAGILVGIVGVVITTGVATSGLAGTVSAGLLALLAAFLYASANIFARRTLRDIDPVVIAAGQIFAGLVIGAVLASIVDAPWTLAAPSASTLAAVAAMGVFGSALAALCNFAVLRRAGATNSMLVTIVLPITPIVLGALFLGEQLSLHEGIGALVIVAALLLIDGRVIRRWVS